VWFKKVHTLHKALLIPCILVPLSTLYIIQAGRLESAKWVGWIHIKIFDIPENLIFGMVEFDCLFIYNTIQLKN
jgi:hypothetical protein